MVRLDNKVQQGLGECQELEECQGLEKCQILDKEGNNKNPL